MIRKYRWLGGGDIGAEGGGGLGRNSFFTLNHEGGFGCPPPLSFRLHVDTSSRPHSLY